MTIVLIVISLAILILACLMGAVRPKRSSLSSFELNRRINIGDKEAKKTFDKELLVDHVVPILKIKSVFLLLICMFLIVVFFNWWVKISALILLPIIYVRFIEAKIFYKYGNKLYKKFESSILKFIKKHRDLMSIFVSPIKRDYEFNLGSSDELIDLIEKSSGLLDEDEKALIVNGLKFNKQKVKTIMTPREKVVSVGRKEFLGPLVLNDLHKTGHTKLPVIDDDLDHIIGTLHLESLFSLDDKKSVTAEKAMEPRVFYIRDNHTLSQALVEFITTRRYLLAVINKAKQTVGILTLSDVMKALTGKDLDNNFDSYDNLRIVASNKKV